MKGHRIVIATPCQDTVAAGFALDLAKLVGYTALARPDLTLLVIQNKGTIIPQQRCALVEKALEHQGDYILWIDSDMRFPKEMLLQFLNREVPIVAANYSTRRPPFLPTAESRELGQLFTTDQSIGLVEVTHCGMGCMLVDTRVYKALNRPWYTLGYSRADDGFVGEDVYFCRQAKLAGFATMVDQDVSKDILHVGEMVYSHAHTMVTRDAWLAEEREKQANGT